MRLRAALAGLLSLSIASAAGAQFAGSNAERVVGLGLDWIEADGVLAFYSDGAGEEGAFYAGEAASAAAWYRAELGWDLDIAMAVLNAEDFELATAIPYPSPHAETRTGFIIIADHVDSHPGFELWDIHERDINAAWLFHEMGHVIARDLGVASNNLWVNELIASVIMAGYIREERPQFAGFQSGMPPRFAGEGNYGTLAEFDQLYFAMGQFDYLWFHFHIAAIADYVVAAAGSLATAVDGLTREFPIGRPPETVAGSLVRLERIAPGVSDLAAPLVP